MIVPGLLAAAWVAAYVVAGSGWRPRRRHPARTAYRPQMDAPDAIDFELWGMIGRPGERR